MQLLRLNLVWCLIVTILELFDFFIKSYPANGIMRLVWESVGPSGWLAAFCSLHGRPEVLSSELPAHPQWLRNPPALCPAGEHRPGVKTPPPLSPFPDVPSGIDHPQLVPPRKALVVYHLVPPGHPQILSPAEFNCTNFKGYTDFPLEVEQCGLWFPPWHPR